MCGQVQQATGDRVPRLQRSRIRIQENVIHIVEPEMFVEIYAWYISRVGPLSRVGSRRKPDVCYPLHPRGLSPMRPQAWRPLQDRADR